MAQKLQLAVDTSYQYQRIAAERALWVIKPVALVTLIVWCLHPATTRIDVMERNTLLGFLFGCTYGLLLSRKVLYYFLVVRRKEKRSLRNEVPDDYFFGKIVEVLYGEGKK